MDAVIYTKSIPEYEMLSGILMDELSDVTVSRGVIDREYHLEREYDVALVGINGAQGMELVCKYRELYGNTLVIWITDDPYFAGVAIRTHIFDFIVRPMDGTRFREPFRRIKEGDIAVWQKIPVKTSVYQGGCISKGNVLEQRETPLPPQGQEHFSFGTTRRNGTIWKRIKDYFLSENTLQGIFLMEKREENEKGAGCTEAWASCWRRL